MIELQFDFQEGSATSIGEQPIKTLVNPPAGARMSVIEALANLAAAPITDLKVKKAIGSSEELLMSAYLVVMCGFCSEPIDYNYLGKKHCYV